MNKWSLSFNLHFLFFLLPETKIIYFILVLPPFLSVSLSQTHTHTLSLSLTHLLTHALSLLYTNIHTLTCSPLSHFAHTHYLSFSHTLFLEGLNERISSNHCFPSLYELCYFRYCWVKQFRLFLRCVGKKSRICL